ncbi:DNA-binding HxlR family transcriptional regulator [Rhizobium sp. BK529]|uniref:winged helix-turn-helix transcriptional regulator n=1 Tax=unclassified Rhizobium TaxID=2613769 RepID=UPI0010482E24|nr:MULTISPECIES: helix-turn-helix domain-containing protein [unclassified Rhizobium]MBB3591942.1 DNA-binding HxlR family transcriptional regulator [Rhizobium sp. BK529]TCS08175.1 HxlR family transcriptional regulator [Rhizobium sp. BK418]
MSLPRAKLLTNFPGCPVEATLSYLDGKWKGVILFHLMDKTLRFNELRRHLPAITQRMLTKQLRELEESGLISRTVYPVVPPRVEYALTPLGSTLKPVIRALAAWGDEFVFCSPEGRELHIAKALSAPAAELQA